MIGKNSRDKKAQEIFGLSFGVIFSIFLIIIFFVVAVVAIKGFLDLGKTSGVGLFYKDFQSEVDRAWNSQSSEFEFKINLPKDIEQVCFANLSSEITAYSASYQQIKDYEFHEANVFLLPPQNTKNMPWKNINHLNISKTTEEKNPYCVPAGGSLIIKKDFYGSVWVQ